MPRQRNFPHELDFTHFWNPFVRFFQFLCISHYGILRPELENRRIKLALHRIFFTLNVLIQLFSVYLFFQFGIKMRMRTMARYNRSPVFMYVSVATKLVEIMFFSVIPFETFYNRHNEQMFFETLRDIDDIFRKLQHFIDYGMHRRRQIRKTWLFFLVIIMFMAADLPVNILVIKPDTFAALIVVFYIFVITRLRVFQVVFYINALCDLLEDLKMLLRRQQHRIKYNSAHWTDIQSVRKIYTKIWLLKTLISDCFGYSMILFVFDSAVKIINCAYWIYLNLEPSKSKVVKIRECIRWQLW